MVSKLHLLGLPHVGSSFSLVLCVLIYLITSSFVAAFSALFHASRLAAYFGTALKEPPFKNRVTLLKFFSNLVY